MKGFIVATIATLVVVQMMMAEPAQAITCPEVVGYLNRCVPYLTGGGEPGAECCSGVKNLVGAVKSPADKREACNCVKEAATHFSSLKDDAAQALPSKCGVKMDIPISTTVNCDALFYY